jgi:hypothetical protein
MAAQLRYFLNRGRRYFARLVVPADLRPYLNGKTELREPLGADRRISIRKHPSAVAALRERIADAEKKRAIASGKPIENGRYALSPSELAAANYRERLLFDDELRLDPRYATIEIDDLLAMRLREAMAGRQGETMTYLIEMDVDPGVMVHGLTTPPNDIYVLVESELVESRLATTIRE